MGRNEHRIARNHHIFPFFGVIAIVDVVNYVRMTVDAGYGLFVQRFLKYHMNQMIRKCGFETKQELVAAAIESTVITSMGE